MKYDTVIGILTVRRFDFLTECVESLFANTPDLTGTVVIVANNSEDHGFIYEVDSLANKYGITTINHRRGRGTSAAWNAMTRLYNCEKVIIINDDIYLHPGWREACEPFLNYDQIGVFGLEAQHGWNNWEYRNPGSPEHASETVANPLTYPPGSFLAYRRERFDEVGGFDENLWMGLEEVDFSIRLMLLGYENFQIGTAKRDYFYINHYGSASGYSPTEAAPELREMAHMGVEHFKKKHKTEWTLPVEFENELRAERDRVRRLRGL